MLILSTHREANLEWSQSKGEKTDPMPTIYPESIADLVRYKNKIKGSNFGGKDDKTLMDFTDYCRVLRKNYHSEVNRYYDEIGVREEDASDYLRAWAPKNPIYGVIPHIFSNTVTEGDSLYYKSRDGGVESALSAWDQVVLGMDTSDTNGSIIAQVMDAALEKITESDGNRSDLTGLFALLDDFQLMKNYSLVFVFTSPYNGASSRPGEGIGYRVVRVDTHSNELDPGKVDLVISSNLTKIKENRMEVVPFQAFCFKQVRGLSSAEGVDEFIEENLIA